MRPAFFYMTALLIAITDQATKWVVVRNLAVNDSRPALGRILYLTHTENTGGAFSLFKANNGIFIAIALVAMVALIYAYHRTKNREPYAGERRSLYIDAAIALALGGAVGNVIDRIRFKHVIDFFDFQGGTGHTLWPIFNVADSAITVGILILAFHFLLQREHKSAQESPVEATTNQAN